MILIDGSTGEGGGQILRSALSLSLATGRAFTMEKIRANRSKGGLLRQHLTCVKAAAAVGGASVRGAELGSTELSFAPGQVRPGDYRFAIGSAGSTTLVLQTVLVPLAFAAGESTVRIEGGTHNSAAPPFEFLEKAFAPVLSRLGVTIEVKLERAGFHPAGGGAIFARLGASASAGSPALSPLRAHERGAVQAVRPSVLLANLSPSIGHREASVVAEGLGVERRDVPVISVVADGPGNVVSIEIETEHAREIVTAFGERGVRAEDVAHEAVRQAWAYLASDAPVGEHLADQLLLPLALGAGGSFRACETSEHLRTNAWLLGQFLGEGAVTLAPEPNGCVVCSVRPRR